VPLRKAGEAGQTVPPLSWVQRWRYPIATEHDLEQDRMGHRHRLDQVLTEQVGKHPLEPGLPQERRRSSSATLSTYSAGRLASSPQPMVLTPSSRNSCSRRGAQSRSSCSVRSAPPGRPPAPPSGGRRPGRSAPPPARAPLAPPSPMPPSGRQWPCAQTALAAGPDQVPAGKRPGRGGRIEEDVTDPSGAWVSASHQSPRERARSTIRTGTVRPRTRRSSTRISAAHLLVIDHGQQRTSSWKRASRGYSQRSCRARSASSSAIGHPQRGPWQGRLGRPGEEDRL
jgi:hypothetical protein